MWTTNEQRTFFYKKQRCEQNVLFRSILNDFMDWNEENSSPVIGCVPIKTNSRWQISYEHLADIRRISFLSLKFKQSWVDIQPSTFKPSFIYICFCKPWFELYCSSVASFGNPKSFSILTIGRWYIQMDWWTDKMLQKRPDGHTEKRWWFKK